MPRAFTRRLGAPPRLNNRVRQELLGLETLWLRQVKLGLVLLFSLRHNNIHSPTNAVYDAGSPPFLLLSRSHWLKLPLI